MANFETVPWVILSSTILLFLKSEISSKCRSGFEISFQIYLNNHPILYKTSVVLFHIINRFLWVSRKILNFQPETEMWLKTSTVLFDIINRFRWICRIILLGFGYQPFQSLNVFPLSFIVEYVGHIFAENY